jgi:hypothetical protein
MEGRETGEDRGLSTWMGVGKREGKRKVSPG